MTYCSNNLQHYINIIYYSTRLIPDLKMLYIEITLLVSTACFVQGIIYHLLQILTDKSNYDQKHCYRSSGSLLSGAIYCLFGVGSDISSCCTHWFLWHGDVFVANTT